MNRVAVVGVGNIWRGDDAVGIVAARGIQLALDSLAECITFIESEGEVTSLLECFKTFDRVYIIDAIQTENFKAGRIFEFDAIKNPLQEIPLHASTHVLGVAQSIEMARILGYLPCALRIFGIEAAQFEHGSPLSKEVKAASERVIQKIVAEIKKETKKEINKETQADA